MLPIPVLVEIPNPKKNILFRWGPGLSEQKAGRLRVLVEISGLWPGMTGIYRGQL